MELVSIIVPTYNVEPYIKRCIESLLCQTYTMIEILIIDDGSTDNTLSICQGYAQNDCRIKIITQEHEGQSIARNRGLDIANGEWFFFVDSDDWIDENTIENMRMLAEKNGADIICCGIQYVYDDERRMMTSGENEIYCNTEALHEMMCNHNICSVVWNKLYKAKLWEHIRFPKGKLHEDEYITYQVLYEARKIYFTKEPYYMYFQRNDGIMGKLLNSNNMDKIEAISERTDFFMERNEDRLVDESLLEGITYTKYLYRSNMQYKSDDLFERMLIDSYKQQMNRIWSRKTISVKNKVISFFWKVVLPMQYKVKVKTGNKNA